MSKFKAEFTLKQHTPIIHFQSKQSGATLRATELKPKFDRFILNDLKSINPSLYEKYKHIIEDETIFPKDGTGSHSYKVSIYANMTSQIATPKAYVNARKETDTTAYQAPYFADASKSVFSTNDIEVSIHSFNTQLVELLDDVKDYIFLYENFGTRQSKGFGVFVRKDLDKKEMLNMFKKHQNKLFTLGSVKDYKAGFLKIDHFYKKLKMGINRPYEKSLIFKYMCSKYNLGWEKKFIKNHFPEVIHGEHKPLTCKVPDDKEFKYIRAVLGLAEHNEFRPTGGKKQVKIKSTSSGIERFKSPITFKIIDNTIYLIYNDSYKKILNKEFSFSLGRDSQTLKTPKEFDMYDFLKFVEKNEQLLSEVK